MVCVYAFISRTCLAYALKVYGQRVYGLVSSAFFHSDFRSEGKSSTFVRHNSLDIDYEVSFPVVLS